MKFSLKNLNPGHCPPAPYKHLSTISTKLNCMPFSILEVTFGYNLHKPSSI